MRLALAAMLLIANLLSPSSTRTFLDDEAGLGAWIYAGQEIILESNLLRNQMRIIEDDQPGYLIGYIASTPQDVKVFISRSGWVAAYHLKGVPASQMDIDCTGMTRLSAALTQIAAAIPIPTPPIHYHHWVYPIADHILQLGSSTGINTEWWFTLPGSYSYHEYSYLSRVTHWLTSTTLKLDDATIGWANSNQSISSGTIPPTSVVHIAPHKVNILNPTPMNGDVCGIITIIYTEAPNGRITYPGVGFARTSTLEPVDPGLLAAAEPVPHLYPIYLPGVYQ